MAEENKTNEITLNEVEKGYLDKMNWTKLQENTKQAFGGEGITREMVEANPKIAKQLANFQVTDGIDYKGEKVSGKVYLRGYFKPDGKGENGKAAEYTVTADLREQKKTIEEFRSLKTSKERAEKGYVFGDTVITSDRAMENLLATTDWVGADGKRKFGPAYANAGVAIGRVRKSASSGTEVKTLYLVGYDQKTNKFFGERMSDVKNNPYVKNFYGVNLSNEEVQAVAEGKVISIELNGQTVYGQYSPVQHGIVAVHPTWLKESQAVVKAVGEKPAEAKAQTEAKAEGKKAAKKAPEAKKAAPKKGVKKSL